VSLTIFGIGNMLGAGIYGLMGKAAGVMGNAIWLSFAASVVAAGCTGLSYACLGSRYPRAAGAAYITQRAYGFPALAYVVGLAVMVSGLVSMAAGSHIFASHLGGMLGGAPAWIIIAAYVGLLGLINFSGMEQSSWVNIACTVVEAAGLLFVIAVGVRWWGSVDYLDATTTANPTGALSAALILQGAVLTFYAFIGFEDVLNVSEEVKNARRTIPIAMVTAISITMLIYMAVAVTAVSVVPHAELAAADKPLVEVVKVAAPWVPAGAFTFIAMFAVTNTGLLNYIMGSRLAYGMAQQGLLPRFLGAVHPRTRTPWVAIAMLGSIVLTLALPGSLKTLASASSLMLLTAFSVVNAALIVLRLRKGEARGAFEVPIVVPAAGIIVCVAMILHADRAPLLLAGGILAGLIVLAAIIRPKFGGD
jgi:amino acid transporter